MTQLESKRMWESRVASEHPNTLPIRIGQATIEVRPGFYPTRQKAAMWVRKYLLSKIPDFCSISDEKTALNPHECWILSCFYLSESYRVIYPILTIPKIFLMSASDIHFFPKSMSRALPISVSASST